MLINERSVTDFQIQLQGCKPESEDIFKILRKPSRVLQ
jgi:hypothetical protein